MKTSILSISRELLNDNYTVRLKTQGYSMYPMLKPDDIIYIEKLPFQELKPSSIVVFRREDRWVAHRLFSSIQKNGQLILKTKGDSCITFDENITEDKYIGRVAFRKRGNQIKSLSDENAYTNAILKCHPYLHYILHLIAKIARKKQALISFFQKKPSVSSQ